MEKKELTPADLTLMNTVSTLLTEARQIKRWPADIGGDAPYYIANDDTKLEMLFEIINVFLGSLDEDFYNTELATARKVAKMNQSYKEAKANNESV